MLNKTRATKNVSRIRWNSPLSYICILYVCVRVCNVRTRYIIRRDVKESARPDVFDI